jgi:hypothetical protein
VGRLAPRPWLAIHGQRDTYIPAEIVEECFERGDGPKELWLVPDAKHNRCREREPEAYAGRLLDFIDRYAPRRPITESPESESEAESEPESVASPAVDADATVELTDCFEREADVPKLSAGEVATPVR